MGSTDQEQLDGRRVRPAVHRDQIHGDVKFDPLSVALLGTDALQRLGRIYQLGYAHLVYRGGTHTRLSHVMGATHTAGKLVDSLRQNYAQKNDYWPLGAISPSVFLPFPGKVIDLRWEFVRHICSWAALLHDVAHIPLGHTLEDEFEKLYPKHDDFHSDRLAYLWVGDSSGEISEIKEVLQNERLYPESFRQLGVTPDEVYGAVLLSCLHKEAPSKDDELKKSFAKVIQGLDDSTPIHKALKKALVDTSARAAFYPFFADLVGDTICADYLDYLRRDPTNVGLDVLRDDRVISCFYVGREETDEPNLYRMALSLVDRSGHPRLDTCTGVIDLVRQRFRFAEIIYYHKTKIAASAMFAKAIKLIGKPNEVGLRKEVISIADIAKLSAGVVDRTKDVSDLRRRMLPSDLLDPEVGDESLHLMLEYRGWDQVAGAATMRDQKTVENSLRGISLLQAISRRKLYKTCFVLDQEAISKLMPGASDHVIEERMARVLKTLRNEGSGDGNDHRTMLESELTAEAGWPEDALILYVPPRKSQAKGIATYALQANTVVTLEKHPAVQNKVEELNKDYKKLWRLILLINPASAYMRDGVGLSKAIDLLTRKIVAIAENSQGEIEFRPDWRGVLSLSCWLKYVPPELRLAAQLFSRLSRTSAPKWAAFSYVLQKCAECEYSVESHGHAALAYMCEVNEDFQIKFAIRDLVQGGGFGGRLEHAMRGGQLLTADASVVKCRSDLDALMIEIENAASVSASDNVVQFRKTGQEGAGATDEPIEGDQRDFGFSQQSDTLALAARTTTPGETILKDETERSTGKLRNVESRERIPDEIVFGKASPISKESKIWKGRLAALQGFFAGDRLGSLDANQEFVAFVENVYQRKPRHIYTVEDLRAQFRQFQSLRP